MVSDSNILVTVVIPAYNHEAYIAQCIESVLNQGIDELELIIIDDASADNTATIAEKYTADNRVTLIINEENLGSFGNNSKAIRLGQGKYFVWLHGDDYLLPGHLLDALIQLENNPHCDLAYSPCYWVDEQDRLTKISQHPGHCLHHYAGGRNEVAELLAYDNYITPSSAVIRKSALDEFTGFDFNIRAGDWYLFVQLALNNPNFIFINRPSTCYRIHEGQFSNEFYKSDKPLRAHIGIVESVLINGQASKLIVLHSQIQEHLINRISSYSEDLIHASMDRLKLIQNTMQKTHDDSLSRPITDHPLVSVIIETRDSPLELENTLASLTQQGYENWEAIVVNNAGCDVSGLLDRFGLQHKIHYVELNRESSYSTAINAGLRFAKGEVISYLNTGDSWSKDHLKLMINGLHEQNKQAVYADSAEIVVINQSGSVTLSSIAHRIELLGLVRMAEEGSRTSDTLGFVQRLASTTDILHLKIASVSKTNSPLLASDITINNDRKDAGVESIENSPLVSIVVPTFNRPDSLKNALMSILEQDYENWEVVVVNDAGEDVEELVSAIDPKNRIRYFSHAINKGLSAARNSALEMATGDIICYLDDDDVFLPMHLNTLVNSLKHSDAGLVYTDSVHVKETMKDGVAQYVNEGNSYFHEDFSIERLHVGNYIPVNTFAHYRNLLKKVGHFDIELSALEDWDMLLRLSRVTKFQHIPLTTVEIRTRDSSVDNMTVREGKRFPILYREIYDRFGDLGNPQVSELRLRTLEHLERVSQNLITVEYQ